MAHLARIVVVTYRKQAAADLHDSFEQLSCSDEWNYATTVVLLFKTTVEVTGTSIQFIITLSKPSTTGGVSSELSDLIRGRENTIIVDTNLINSIASLMGGAFVLPIDEMQLQHMLRVNLLMYPWVLESILWRHQRGEHLRYVTCSV